MFTALRHLCYAGRITRRCRELSKCVFLHFHFSKWLFNLLILFLHILLHRGLISPPFNIFSMTGDIRGLLLLCKQCWCTRWVPRTWLFFLSGEVQVEARRGISPHSYNISTGFFFNLNAVYIYIGHMLIYICIHTHSSLKNFKTCQKLLQQ